MQKLEQEPRTLSPLKLIMWTEYRCSLNAKYPAKSAINFCIGLYPTLNQTCWSTHGLPLQKQTFRLNFSCIPLRVQCGIRGCQPGAEQEAMYRKKEKSDWSAELSRPERKLCDVDCGLSAGLAFSLHFRRSLIRSGLVPALPVLQSRCGSAMQSGLLLYNVIWFNIYWKEVLDIPVGYWLAHLKQ